MNFGPRNMQMSSEARPAIRISRASRCRTLPPGACGGAKGELGKDAG